MEYWHTGALMSEGNWFKLLLNRKDPEILDSMETSVRSSSVSSDEDDDDDDDSRLILTKVLTSSSPEGSDLIIWSISSAQCGPHITPGSKCVKGQVRVCFYFLFSTLLTSP